jgi:hypothetical protein
MAKHQWVALTRNIRPQGLPTAVHHRQTRGAHPELKLEPTNLVGIDQVFEHTPYHDQGEKIADDLDLALMWR